MRSLSLAAAATAIAVSVVAAACGMQSSSENTVLWLAIATMTLAGISRRRSPSSS
jgi:hypothetical protein